MWSSLSVSGWMYEGCETKSVVSIHRNCTAQSAYKQVELQMLFYASNLWSPVNAPAHAQTQSQTHNRAHKPHKMKQAKVDVKMPSCQRPNHDFSWRTSQLPLLEREDHWDHEGAVGVRPQRSKRRAGFSHASVITQKQARTQRHTCMAACISWITSGDQTRSMSWGSITISEKGFPLPVLCRGHAYAG